MLYHVINTIDGFITYNFAYLLVMPRFMCRSADSSGNFESCNHSDFYKNGQCDPHVEFYPDMSNSNSIYNWAYDLELFCSPQIEIALFGSAYFAGYFIGSLTLSRLSDVVGRKPMTLLGLCIITSSQAGMILYQQQIAIYAFLFSMGVFTSVFAPGCYIMNLENAPSKYHNIIGSTY